MNLRNATQKREAVEQHSRQASEFAVRYSQLADPYRSCFTYSRRRLDVKLEALLPRSQGLRLLDVGCGTGHHLGALGRRGFDVAGVDASDKMVALARRNAPSAVVKLGDAEALPFSTGEFDVVICIEVLRYLPELHKSLLEIARVLKPGGVCLATAIPPCNLNGYWLINRFVTTFQVPGFVHLKQFFHSPTRLRREFKSAGFGRIAVHGVYIGPVNWVERAAPTLLPSVLRRWEPLDGALADRTVLRELSNMVVVYAVRGEAAA